MAGQLTLRVVCDGVVQGVGYREWAQKVAREKGIVGWVRNRRDGTIEAVLRGDTSIVQSMLTDMRTGPREAQVSGVSAEPWRGDVGTDFEIVATV